MVKTEFLKDHQRDALIRVLALKGRAGMWMRMRTGKTRVALSCAALEQCTRVLIVAPLSAVPGWESEFAVVKDNLKKPWDVELFDLSHGSIIKRKDRIQHLIRGKVPAVVIVNYESFWREPLRGWIMKWEPDAVIFDEGHRIRHRGSRQARFAHILGAKPHVRVCLSLSGTPITNGNQDAWSVIKPIAPGMFGNYAQFEGRYMVMGGFRGKQIIGYQNDDELHDRIDAISFKWEGRFPEPTDVPIVVRLDPKTRKVYDELKKKSLVELQDAQGQSRTVIATIVLTLLLRLQQVTCGFTMDANDSLVEISDEKASMAIDLMSDAIANKEKVVIFCRFLHDLDLLERSMPKGTRYARIDGSRSGPIRKQIIRDLHAGKLDVIIAQTKTASLGVDFTPCNVGIFFSAGFSLDEFIQAKARMDGFNQSKSVSLYYLVAERTIDQEIYTALQAKTNVAEKLMDLNYAFRLFSS